MLLFIITDNVVDLKGSGPDDGHWKERHGEENKVQDGNQQNVRQPNAPAIQPAGVGILQTGNHHFDDLNSVKGHI